MFQYTAGGEAYVGLAGSLGAPDSGDPVALVLRSRTAQLRFLDPLHWQIAVTATLAVVIATGLAYAIARTVTRPVRALTTTMREMAATGDLARPVPAPGRWDDEDARVLSGAFSQLAGSLDRFQREAAQRERLSSLGRLSAVIAHEVRNPLMIIKAAARGLRRHPAPEVAEAVASIDEEVTRLDRVVTDVLDFARPIQLAPAPADLADICRDAVQAAQAGPEAVAVTMDIRAAAPAVPVVIDAERLRTVLVNVLNNAQQAVRARGAATRGRPPVRLSVEEAPGGWRIEVADAGIGIRPEDQARLFEPFFTTRRGGSGLGLALSRNIIEALGGTIAVQSGEAGTTVRLIVPSQPPTAPEARRK
jgi:signal transduction histidine kinase